MEGVVLTALQAVRIDGLTQLVALISALGNGSFIWIVLALVMILFEETRQSGLITIFVLVITSVICFVLTNVFGRVCPTETVTGLVGVMGVGHAGYCFPSIHAATAFAAAVCIFRGVGGGPGMVAMVWAVLESLSRLYLGVNYPSDVLAGAVLGFVVGLLIFLLLDKVFGLIDFKPKRGTRKSVSTNRGRHSL